MKYGQFVFCQIMTTNRSAYAIQLLRARFSRRRVLIIVCLN